MATNKGKKRIQIEEKEVQHLKAALQNQFKNNRNNLINWSKLTESCII